MIRITSRIALDEASLEERFVRSPGPGGQNVNKLATAVELRCDLARAGLPVDVSERLGRSRGIPAAPPAVAVGIPADLLRRRPDVRRAERSLAAQSARIGVAKGRFEVPDSIDADNAAVARLFHGSLR